MANLLIITLKALAHPGRLRLLKWLGSPVEHFPPQVDGDLIRDGVCAVFIANKLGVSPPTASRHLQLMVNAGLLIATRKKQWTFYRRNEAVISRIKKKLKTL